MIGLSLVACSRRTVRYFEAVPKRRKRKVMQFVSHRVNPQFTKTPKIRVFNTKNKFKRIFLTCKIQARHNFVGMAELTNLTDRIAHLRDRKTGSPIIQGDPEREQRPKNSRPPNATLTRERRFSNDYFVVFVYTLLGIALLTQFTLIAWLDIV